MSSIEAVLRALNRGRVRYLLIGGLASVLYGVPRTTVDLDLALDSRRENLTRAIRAVRRAGLVPDTDVVEDILGQGGVTASNRISVDLLTSLPTGTFAPLWRRRRAVRFRGVQVPVVSKADQIRLLRGAGRRKDLEDAEYLESLP